MLDVGLLCRVYITSRASLHVETVQDLLYIATAITCVFYLHLIVSRSFILSCTCKGCVVGKHAEFNYEKWKLMYYNYRIYSDVYYHCMLLYLHWRCVLPLYRMSKLCLDIEVHCMLGK